MHYSNNFKMVLLEHSNDEIVGMLAPGIKNKLLRLFNEMLVFCKEQAWTRTFFSRTYL